MSSDMPSPDFIRLQQHSEPSTQTRATSLEGAVQPSCMLSVAELEARPARLPDYEAESRALVMLSREMARSPENILTKLADVALTLCRADSAGVSLLSADGEKFQWPAIVGRWAEHVGGGTPRHFGPCGTVLDRNMSLLCTHPERDFPYFGDVQPPVEEALLIPFYMYEKAVGTIWIVAHDTRRRFDSEDLRLMTNLGSFAEAAYQTWTSFDATQRMASIVESSDDPIIAEDLEGIITSWNRAAERVYGYSAEEVLGKSITILISPERKDEERVMLERIKRGERIEQYETVRQRKDGSTLDVSLTVSPIRDAAGRIAGASKIARDITERKRAQAQIALLAREAEHRAKNVLATVQATVSLSKSDTPDGLKRSILGRIQALANAHRLFAQTRWTGADLRALALEELLPYRQEGEARAQVDGPDVTVKPDAAQAIAVILHELATNAAKYGALSVPGGRLRVGWSHVSDERLVLRWTETGGPPTRPPTHEGFGTRVMKSMIGSLKGDIRLDWRDDGLVCEIALPI